MVKFLLKHKILCGKKFRQKKLKIIEKILKNQLTNTKKYCLINALTAKNAAGGGQEICTKIADNCRNKKFFKIFEIFFKKV